MTKTAYSYTVLRYVHDTTTGEFINAGESIRTASQTIVLMPANVPHALQAIEASRMLLIMLRETLR